MTVALPTAKKPEKRKLNASILSTTEALIKEIRLHRGTAGDSIPDASTVVDEAIVEFAQRELPSERFDRVMGFAS